jgi:TPP-dependent pyruvate/acetoin dehydrogenase alpha subunit
MPVLPIKPPEHTQVSQVMSDGRKGFACVAIVCDGAFFEGVYDTREEAMQHMREWQLPIFLSDEWLRSTPATTLD